ncbi:hypothetical protein SH661x_002015 [Planctomicrobium sp. SH661]|uniref:hypothetical protein n=1 Tax=Planctomicrobium sp. SH661 TaxID=3448124 RepID=UPI003F5B14B3
MKMRNCLLLAAMTAFVGLQSVSAQEESEPARAAIGPRQQFPARPPFPNTTLPRGRVTTGNIVLGSRDERRSGQERVDHLRMAAENLTLAGFEQEADQLRERAAVLEKDLARAQSLQTHPERLAMELRELRESVDLLRQEVRELRGLLRSEFDSDRESVGITRAPHEGRIRLQDRSQRIPDEALDAASGRETYERPASSRQPVRNQRSEPTEEPEFELVPVPLESTPPEPMPTPVPTPAVPKE